MGLDKAETSLGVRGLIGRLCSYMPDRKATCEAELLTSVKLAPSTTQHISRAIGEQLVREWKAEEELLRANGLPGPSRFVPCLHTSMDGVFIYVDKK